MSREGEDAMRVKRPVEPPSLAPLSAVFQAVAADPSEGEIWRAAWARCVQLVLVVEVGDSDIDVVPVSSDVEIADEQTVRISPAAPLTHPLCAWSGLRQWLPMRVLDVCITAVGALELEAVCRGDGEGAPITSLLDERDQLRTKLSDRMAELAAATWLPSSSGGIDLAKMLREHNLAPSALARELGVAPGDITAIARGDRAPSPEQANILSHLLEVEAEQILSIQVDPDLVWVLDRPQFRHRLAERGLAESEPDEAAWRYQVATSKLPIAARTTGTSDARHRWMGLIESFLDES